MIYEDASQLTGCKGEYKFDMASNSYLEMLSRMYCKHESPQIHDYHPMSKVRRLD